VNGHAGGRSAVGQLADRAARVSWRLGLLLSLGLGLAPSRAQGQLYAHRGPPSFPHQKHVKLFPTCNGCHVGITTGDAGRSMPPPESCVECHDGTVRPRVPYSAPRPRPDFLTFAHREHARQVEVSARGCSSCHALAADTGWMLIRRATPEGCQGCHTHRASAHLGEDSRCTTCHRPLARSASLTEEQVRSLPRPPSHAAARFAAQHAPADEGQVAQCATCHARESCARCHVNARSVASIQRLESDARVAAIQRGRSGAWPAPEDHGREAWDLAHGRAALAGVETCGACHAQPSCTVCHTGPAGREAIRRLPDGRDGARGVQLTLPRRIARAGGTGAVARAPAAIVAVVTDTATVVAQPHPPNFAQRHGASAASGRLTCEGCHARQFCADCHAGETRRRFHPSNFVARHAPEANHREVQCSSCHNAEVFCRGCHQTLGLASSKQSGGVYHNGQPLWLLQHGQAARLTMQTCTSCHVQRDCLQCHSQRGWGVNPHGPGFNAERLGSRARPMCARCHLADPTRGG